MGDKAVEVGEALQRIKEGLAAVNNRVREREQNSQPKTSEALIETKKNNDDKKSD